MLTDVVTSLQVRDSSGKKKTGKTGKDSGGKKKKSKDEKELAKKKKDAKKKGEDKNKSGKKQRAPGSEQGAGEDDDKAERVVEGAGFGGAMDVLGGMAGVVLDGGSAKAYGEYDKATKLTETKTHVCRVFFMLIFTLVKLLVENSLGNLCSPNRFIILLIGYGCVDRYRLPHEVDQILP